MKFILKLLVTGLAVLITSYLLPGVTVDGMMGAIIVAAVLGLLNAIVKPLMVLLTLPVTVITLGLFLLVINAVIIMIADSILPGFDVENFWWALLFSLILSVISSVFEATSGKEGH